MTLAAPEQWGGQGLPLALSAALMEDLNAANIGFALCPMLSMGAIEALQHHGSDELKERYLAKIVCGEWPATMNLTEPQAGSDVGALKTRAEPNDDGSWRIKGTKIFITYGDHDLAEQIIHLVLARTPGAPEGTRGISLFLVPKILPDGSANDLHCVSIEHKLGIHASPTCVMSYGDVSGATGWMIGGENQGMRAMFTMMNNARLNVGLAGRRDRRTRHPARGRLCARSQAIGQGDRRASRRAADAASDAEPDDGEPRLGLLRLRPDRPRGEGRPVRRLRGDVLTPLAKAWGTDVGCEVASLGVQVHGGMGYIEETGAAQHLRDARIAPIYEGTNGIQAADLVGRKLGLDGGLAFDGLIADIEAEAQHPGLIALTDTVEVAAATLRAASPEDRLAGSYPFLTMCSVMVGGWLVERLARAPDASDRDRAAAEYFLSVVVPEALGLGAAAESGAALLFAVRGGGAGLGG